MYMNECLALHLLGAIKPGALRDIYTGNKAALSSVIKSEAFGTHFSSLVHHIEIAHQ